MPHILRFIFTGAMVCFLPLAAFAGAWEFDTTAGSYYNGTYSTSYRNSRLARQVSGPISARLVQSVVRGYGLTGEANNYRYGVQVLDSALIKMPPSCAFVPYVGLSVASSDIASNSLSMDAGAALTYAWKPWLLPKIGFDFMGYKDSYMLDYHAGASFPVYRALSLDLLYTGLLNNNGHDIGGGLRITVLF